MVRETPDRIGRYEILQELGQGSMGRVFLARDPNIDRRVAIKVLAPISGGAAEEEAELRRRFILEARAAGKVNHPGIVTVHDAESDPESGGSFIAMEWIDGESLEQVMGRGALPVDEAVRLGEQLALALDAAHRAGLVHRDVKPANILLDRSGRAKISDFGIAKFTSMSNTAAGRLVGSPFYMSPEQVRNETVDGRSDLFSLGTVLYQAVTGRVPFEGDSLAGITYKVLEIDPPPASSVNTEVSLELDAVIDRALRKDPDERYQNGREFAQALRALEIARYSGTTPARTAPSETEVSETAGSETAASRTGTLILPPESPSDSIAKSAPHQRSWIARPSGALLAGLTLVALPFVLFILAPSSDEPIRDVQVGSTAVETDTAETPGSENAAEALNRGREISAQHSTSSPGAQPARPAVVEIRYRNHLRSGRMTVRVDDAVVWTGEVGDDEGLLARTVGNSIRQQITVPAGKHVIGVRIEGTDGTVDATKRIWAVFESGARPRLRVRLVPPRVLRLSWDD